MSTRGISHWGLLGVAAAAGLALSACGGGGGSGSGGSRVFLLTPTNLNGTAISDTRVDLSWTDNSGNESGFRIERSASGSGSFASIGTVGTDVTTFSDTTTVALTSYDYRVFAISGASSSNASNTVTVTTPAPGVPAAPTDLMAISVGANQVDLTWTDNGLNEDGFEIQRSLLGAGMFSTVGTVTTNVTTFSDTTATSTTAYDYQVRSFNTTASSAFALTRLQADIVINEVDYDNPGIDDNEFVELYNAGNGAQDLTNLAVVFMNGNGNTEYRRVALSAAATQLDPGQYLVIAGNAINAGIPGSALTINVGVNNLIENGPTDGLAIWDTMNLVALDVLSYEGAYTAATIDAQTVNLVEGTALTASDDPNTFIATQYAQNGLFFDISSTGTPLNILDDQAVLATGATTNRLFTSGDNRVTDNGGILNNTATGNSLPTNGSLPSVDLNSGANGAPTLAAWWDDLRPSTAGTTNVFAQTVTNQTVDNIPGIAATIFQWHNRDVVSGGTGDGVTFQLWIYDSTSPVAFRVVYSDVDAAGTAGDNGATATFGLQATSGSLEDEVSVDTAILGQTAGVQDVIEYSDQYGLSRFPNGTDTDDANSDWQPRARTPGRANR